MSILLNILIVVGIIISIILILALIAPKAYTVTRSILIQQPAAVVYEYIKYLNNQENYSKWATMDPNTINTYTGTAGTVGSSHQWESKQRNVGMGIQTITALEPNAKVSTTIEFIKPFAGVAQASLSTQAKNDYTQVVWELSSTMKYPSNALLLVMNMNKMIGNDLEVGLANLKNVLEN